MERRGCCGPAHCRRPPLLLPTLVFRLLTAKKLEKGWDLIILPRIDSHLHPVTELLSSSLWRSVQQALANPKERQLPINKVVFQRRPLRRKHSDASHEVLRVDLLVEEGLLERRFL